MPITTEDLISQLEDRGYLVYKANEFPEATPLTASLQQIGSYQRSDWEIREGLVYKLLETGNWAEDIIERANELEQYIVFGDLTDELEAEDTEGIVNITPQTIVCRSNEEILKEYRLVVGYLSPPRSSRDPSGFRLEGRKSCLEWLCMGEGDPLLGTPAVLQ